MSRATDDPAHRALVLTASAADRTLVRQGSLEAGLPCEFCADLNGLLASMASQPAGAAVIAEQALDGERAQALRAALEAQEPWSDLPVLLLADTAPEDRPGVHAALREFERANVTILERPLRRQLLTTSLQAAIRGRRRQYQMRDLLDELRRAVQLSDLFVSILGHDLRTPLAAIKLSAEFIVRLPESRALRPAGRILSSADRMNRMIEQLLDFARVRQGHGMPLRQRPADLGDICRAVVEEVEDAHPQAQFMVEQKGDLSGEWDSDRLAQLLSNLVTNAVRHGEPGGPVRVGLDGTDRSGIRVRVQNLGAVPPAVLPVLFEAFKGTGAHAHEARPSRSGLGLGLFIAREIARGHGGDITVRSSPQEGTTFEVVVPRQQPVPEGI